MSPSGEAYLPLWARTKDTRCVPSALYGTRERLTAHTHAQIIVGAKNIAISDDAYHRLKALRKPGESFTDVIQRLTRNRGVLDLVGVLTKTEGRELRRNVAKIRKRAR